MEHTGKHTERCDHTSNGLGVGYRANTLPKKISFDENDTLKSSYDKLQTGLVELFKANWEKIKYNRMIPKRQKGTGSYYKSSDKSRYQELLTEGFDTKIKDLTKFPSISNVKKLTKFEPAYQLRVGDYRVLFDVTEDTIEIGRILHRKDSY